MHSRGCGSLCRSSLDLPPVHLKKSPRNQINQPALSQSDESPHPSPPNNNAQVFHTPADRHQAPPLWLHFLHLPLPPPLVERHLEGLVWRALHWPMAQRPLLVWSAVQALKRAPSLMVEVNPLALIPWWLPGNKMRKDIRYVQGFA